MKHERRPSVDGLETRALLSPRAASLTTLTHALHAEVRRVISGSEMAVTLMTNQASYKPGEIAQMTLTLTNVSKHNETIPFGPSTDGFFITHDSKVIWRSSLGFVPQFVAKRIIAPGQSISLSAHWTVSASTGSFVVHNQLTPSGPTATFKVTTAPISPT